MDPGTRLILPGRPVRALVSAGWRWIRGSALAQAGLAIGVAGAGRIVVNSIISLRFGHVVFAGYGALVASVMLGASLAIAGPAAAITLCVARNRAAGHGAVSRPLLRYLARFTAGYLVVALLIGCAILYGRPAAELWLWIGAVALFVVYQAARPLGYALEEAGVVTWAEAMGAALALGAVTLLAVRSQAAIPLLVLAYALGPVGFLLAFTWLIRSRIRWRDDATQPAERHLARRVSVIFLVGVGSSMTMQYLSVIIAGHSGATEVTAVLFGALQAMTPLLLLSRVYGTVMMPAIAAADSDTRSQRHNDLLVLLYLPGLGLALGLAPFVVISLGLPPEPGPVTVAGLVGLMILMQVWATPAVTALSSRGREIIPAGASLAGLVVAGLVWVAALRWQIPLLLPAGLALGGVVRSLVPMWLYSGGTLGFRGGRVRRLLPGLGMTALLVFPTAWGGGWALAGGTVLVLTAVTMLIYQLRRLRVVRANTPRQ